MKSLIMLLSIQLFLVSYADAETKEQSFCRSQSELAESVAIARDKGLGKTELNNLIAKKAETLSDFREVGAAIFLGNRAINYVIGKPGLTPNETFHSYYTECQETKFYQQFITRLQQ